MTTTIHVEKPAHRNPVAAAMQKRHGSPKTRQIFKDKRTPRAGSRNRQRDYREEGES